MKTEATLSNIPYCDDDRKNLEKLLDTFGTMASLEDIASAYCQAGRNVYTAGDILCNLQRSSSSAPTLSSKDEQESINAFSSSDIMVPKFRAENYFSMPKSKNRTVSMGTVSGIIGAEYARPRRSALDPPPMTKPLKLLSSEIPASEIWEEEVPSEMRTETMHKDMEEFLLVMLGKGFQLDMNVIREVLGGCGYDVKKSLEKLMNTAESTLEMTDDISSFASQTPMEECQDLHSLKCQGNSQHSNSAGSVDACLMSRNELELRRGETDIQKLEKDILNSLFSAPERIEVVPRRTLPPREPRRSRAFGQPVRGPLTDTITNPRTGIVKRETNGDENEDNEDDYEALQEAVKEYWITMKEYYSAAADAYANGNHAQAYKLLEEGHFFMDKARVTNEKFAEKLTENKDGGEMFSLDVHDYESNEAIRLLKLHLINLAGIASIQYLKVIVGANANNKKDRARSKRLVLHITKLLEKESITWTEESNGQALRIRVDEINPNRLSFAKK